MEHRGPVDPSALEVDVSLLSGFSFACRPGCALCCFTSPRLDGDDERRLRAVAPTLRLIEQHGERCVAARPDGGACQLLRQHLCSAHAARPAPCREFPVSVHIGTRLQATVVLSCPGLPLEPVRSFVSASRTGSFSGMDSELRSVRERLTPQVERLRSEATRRRRRVVRRLSEQGRWVDDDEVRRRLETERLVPDAETYLPDELPTTELGLEQLPMYYEGRPGPVVLAQSAGGWEALELSADGGARSIGVAVPPGEPPSLERGAEELLVGYLRYWLARDGFLAAVHHDMLSLKEGSVVDAALAELHAIGSDVLVRAAVRARLDGTPGTRLTVLDMERGIRATDQDWLDRPTWGSRL